MPRLKRGLVALVVAGALLLLGFAGYRLQSGRVFVPGQVELRTFSMPGRPVTTTTINSSGDLVREEEVNREVRSRISTQLHVDDVEKLRAALAGLRDLSGEYRPPFWDTRSDHQYLSIIITLGDGTRREILLEATIPPEVENLLMVLNGMVGEEFKVRFSGQYTPVGINRGSLQSSRLKLTAPGDLAEVSTGRVRTIDTKVLGTIQAALHAIQESDRQSRS